MNVSRLVASVGGYFYSTGPRTLAVHLYGGNSAKLTIDGKPVTVQEVSRYPWEGRIRIALDLEGEQAFAVKLRIPGWARSATASVNGTPVDVAANSDHGYLAIDRTWKAGDIIDLELPMPVERIYAHPSVSADAGRLALKRGPLVYCAEQVDNPGRAISLLRLPRASAVAPMDRPDLFGGTVTLVAEGLEAETDAWGGSLYSTTPPGLRPARITAIPYYLWNNREPGPMQVWFLEG
jgi:DUF1680 family protein